MSPKPAKKLASEIEAEKAAAHREKARLERKETNRARYKRRYARIGAKLAAQA